jgi:hypothetical protein
MTQEFIPYQQAVALKELRFDEPCFGYYEPNKKFKYLNWETFKDFPYLAKNSEWQDLYGAPTFSQAFRWFRENHFLNYKIFRDGGYWICVVNSFKDEDYSSPEDKANTYGLGVFNTYPEAELACLIKLIEIVKEKL